MKPKIIQRSLLSALTFAVIIVSLHFQATSQTAQPNNSQQACTSGSISPLVFSDVAIAVEAILNP